MEFVGFMLNEMIQKNKYQMIAHNIWHIKKQKVTNRNIIVFYRTEVTKELGGGGMRLEL